MKKNFWLFLGLVFMITTVTSCKKYENDEGMQLSSPKKRLVRTWVEDSYYDAATNATVTATSASTITIEKDGTLTYASTVGSVTGTWTLSDDKMELTTELDLGTLGTSKSTSSIVKLTKEELWLEETDGDQTHLKAK